MPLTLTCVPADDDSGSRGWHMTVQDDTNSTRNITAQVNLFILLKSEMKLHPDILPMVSEMTVLPCTCLDQGA